MEDLNTTTTITVDPTDDTINSSNDIVNNPYPYESGDVIGQEWHGFFIFFAFCVALVSSYSAIRLLDHAVWRSEKEKEVAGTVVIIQHPDVLCAIILGFGTVWSMHFVGMSAVTLHEVPMCYNWGLTMASLFAVVGCMGWGLNLAQQDIFAGADRMKVLKKIIVEDPRVTRRHRGTVGCWKFQMNAANFAIHKVAFFYHPTKIILGSISAAMGALIMHYTGMLAVRGPFQQQWSMNYIIGSAILGLTICAVGFWIIFRLLHWKVEQFWLRPASAAVIALAVCLLHFFGMLSVTYVFDEELVNECAIIPEKQDTNPNYWSTHQILNLVVAFIVPALALYVENTICRELMLAYAKLRDPSFNIDSILSSTPSSQRDTSSGTPHTRRVTVTGLDMKAAQKETKKYSNKKAAKIMASDFAGRISAYSIAEEVRAFTLEDAIENANGGNQQQDVEQQNSDTTKTYEDTSSAPLYATGSISSIRFEEPASEFGTSGPTNAGRDISSSTITRTGSSVKLEDQIMGDDILFQE